MQQGNFVKFYSEKDKPGRIQKKKKSAAHGGAHL
jgi:hypothetical protein